MFSVFSNRFSCAIIKKTEKYYEPAGGEEAAPEDLKTAVYDAFLQRFSEGKYTVSDDLEKLGDAAYRTNVTVKDC